MPPSLSFRCPGHILSTLLELADARDGSARRGEGSPAGPLDGRLDPPSTLSPAEAEALVEAGVLLRPQAESEALADLFVAAARTLRRARAAIEVHLWSGRTEMRLSTYVDGGPEGLGVSVVPDGGGFRTTAPVRARDLLAWIQSRFLEPRVRSAGATLQALLDPVAATTLFASLDWLRAASPATDGLAAPDLDPGVIASHHASGVALGNTQCFAPYVRLALGEAVDLGRSDASNAFAALEDAGLRAATGQEDPHGHPLGQLSHPAAVIEGALHWNVVRASNGVITEERNRVVVGVGGRLMLSLDRVPGGLLLSVPDATHLREEMKTEIDHTFGSDPATDLGAPDPHEATSSTARGAASCPECGAESRPGLRFCTTCGTRLRR